jgi:cell division topological specificity factor
MALFDFLQHLLGLQKPSATTARERLQLVLAHDRSDLNPELLERMRREILEVVQKYVEIDIESGDVSLTTDDRVTALVANLPIRRARPLSRLSQEAGARTNPSDPEVLAIVDNPEMPEISPSNSSEVIEVQDAAIEPKTSP